MDSEQPSFTEVEYGNRRRVSRREQFLETMSDHDRAIESRKAAVRAKVEHPFLIVKRDFAFTKTPTAGSRRTSTTSRCCFASGARCPPRRSSTPVQPRHVPSGPLISESLAGQAGRDTAVGGHSQDRLRRP